MTEQKTQILKLTGKEDENDIFERCSKHLKKGGLVSFPTETVYGLGANALDEVAVKKIYQAKGRPFTDPVICHVYSIEQALELVDLSKREEKLFRFLSKHCWPGALTIVSKSNKKIVPECVTAGTGFVGIRSPKNETALKLIKKSNLPISAPSANRFGHVSPTRASHVFDDLSNSEIPILILDSNEICEIGIESTVVKLEEEESKLYLTILRRGGISFEKIEKLIKNFDEEIIFSSSFKKVKNNTKVGQPAPGQMITHYAPDITTFLVKNISEDHDFVKNLDLKTTVIIDFENMLEKTKEYCLKYFNLSQKGDILEATNSVFDILRQSEKVENAKLILLADVSLKKVEDAPALFDRMFRSASGKYIFEKVNILKEKIEILE
eukprot:gene1085-10604_t